MKKYHDISDLKFRDGLLVIAIDGEPNTFPLKEISPALEKASEAERNSLDLKQSKIKMVRRRNQTLQIGSHLLWAGINPAATFLKPPILVSKRSI